MNDEYKKMLERFEQICQNAKKELCGEKEKEQVKEVIEQISYQEKDTLIEQQDKEIERLKELCDKYEEEHNTTFETWQKDIKENKKLHSIIKEATEYIKEKYIEDYSNNDNYIPLEQLNLKNCSWERSLQVLEILDKENK